MIEAFVGCDLMVTFQALNFSSVFHAKSDSTEGHAKILFEFVIKSKQKLFIEQKNFQIKMDLVFGTSKNINAITLSSKVTHTQFSSILFEKKQRKWNSRDYIWIFLHKHQHLMLKYFSILIHIIFFAPHKTNFQFE